MDSLWMNSCLNFPLRGICSVLSLRGSTVMPFCAESLASEINTLACRCLPSLRGQRTMFTLIFPSARSKVVWLWKSGRMATLISNHNNRLTMELRRLGHFYYGNNCLLGKLLRVWKDKKAHRQSEKGLFLPSENSKSPRCSSSWPPLNYSPRDLVIIQTYCCILCL